MPLLTTLVLVLTFFGCASVAKECAKTDMLTMADSPYVPGCSSDVGFARFLTTMPLLATVVLVLTFFGCANAAKECTKTDILTMADSPYVAGCTSDAGFSAMLSIKHVTQEELAVVCASTSCAAHIKLVDAMGVGDCILPETTVHLYTDVVNPYKKRCTSIQPKGSSSSTSNDGFIAQRTSEKRVAQVRRALRQRSFTQILRVDLRNCQTVLVRSIQSTRPEYSFVEKSIANVCCATQSIS
ncbi:unnamed protein product [Peronospora belbahrii]|uniref:Elicitin-like protein n=1 Tax=Peronospora belbahrii TaxID=622444 RepID=A0ABN8CVK9_9STRA|nr:unnamed protein product [Peronospora belbahrii]